MQESVAVESTVDVLLFSVLRDQVGASSLKIDLDGTVTAGVVLKRIAEKFPSVEPLIPTIRIAVNQEYVRADHPVRSGDEVALITPVSGG